MSYVEDQMRNTIRDHVLELNPISPDRTPLEGDLIHCYTMRPPKGGRMMSTVFFFTHEGIVIMGDLSPGRYGLISVLGYGIGWFRGKLSERYLCEKFLSEEWQAEAAKEWCVGEIKDIRSQEHDLEPEVAKKRIKELRTMAHELRNGHMDSTLFYYALQDLDPYYVDDGIPGMDYPRADAGWLCCLQQKFAELFNESHVPQKSGA